MYLWQKLTNTLFDGFSIIDYTHTVGHPFQYKDLSNFTQKIGQNDRFLDISELVFTDFEAFFGMDARARQLFCESSKSKQS